MSTTITSPSAAAIEVTPASGQPRSWDARPADQPWKVSRRIAAARP
ncbi:MAG: hypothetical protein ACHQCE_23030 [Streptosporangiales bacterium]